AGLFGVVAIGSAHDHSLALKADGTAVAWLGGVPPFPNSNIVAVVAGDFFSLGLRNDGTLPSGLSPLIGFPGASNITAIAGGGINSFVMLRNEGTVSGYNVTIPEGLSNVIAVSQGLALKNDGTVVALDGAVTPPGLTNVSQISGTVARGLVLTTNPP